MPQPLCFRAHLPGEGGYVSGHRPPPRRAGSLPVLCLRDWPGLSCPDQACAEKLAMTSEASSGSRRPRWEPFLMQGPWGGGGRGTPGRLGEHPRTIRAPNGPELWVKLQRPPATQRPARASGVRRAKARCGSGQGASNRRDSQWSHHGGGHCCGLIPRPLCTERSPQWGRLPAGLRSLRLLLQEGLVAHIVTMPGPGSGPSGTSKTPGCGLTPPPPPGYVAQTSSPQSPPRLLHLSPPRLHGPGGGRRCLTRAGADDWPHSEPPLLGHRVPLALCQPVNWESGICPPHGGLLRPDGEHTGSAWPGQPPQLVQDPPPTPPATGRS